MHSIGTQDLVEVEYKYLLVLDPTQSQRPKPSPDAKPLPENLSNTKEHSADNRKDGVPSKGDPFLDPAAEQVWEEFNSVYASEVKNPFQKKVDLSKNGQDGKDVGLWYFLGRTSTEARPQFTHDVKIQTNNPKSNFLDSVREPVQKYTPMTPQRASYGYGSYGQYANFSSAGQLAARPQPALQPRPSTGAIEMIKSSPKSERMR